MRPFFADAFPALAPRTFAWSRGGLALGFGYPLCERRAFEPWGIFFNPERSWASPFKALLLLSDRVVFRQPSSVPALSVKTRLGP